MDLDHQNMASIALMIGGVILNATTFVGGSYLARYLSGKDGDAEKVRHDKAMEKYQRDYEAYQENRERVAAWMQEQHETEDQAFQNLSNTDKALKLYNEVHAEGQTKSDETSQMSETGQSPIPRLEEPQFSDYYRPSSSQKMGEMVYVGGGVVALAFMASRIL